MKKAVFLIGAMGSGKSTLLERASFVSQHGYVCHCEEFDILGRKQHGADSLSGDKKEEVWASLKNYKGKIVIAGQYYSSQKDFTILANSGFQLICVFLHVPREVVYQRVLKRGSGHWNENTYASNLRSRLSFFHAFPGRKHIWDNITLEQSVFNYKRLCLL